MMNRDNALSAMAGLRAVSFALLFCACGCDADSVSLTIDAYCHDRCERGRQCGFNVAPRCEAECGDRSIVRAVRSDVLRVWRDCAEELSCTASEQEFSRCSAQALEELLPSDTAFAFCQNVAAFDLQCGYSVDTFACAEDMKIFNDDLLTYAARCTDADAVACGEEWTCFDRTAGF